MPIQRFKHAETIAIIDSLKRERRLTLENLEIMAAGLEHWQPEIADELQRVNLILPSGAEQRPKGEA